MSSITEDDLKELIDIGQIGQEHMIRTENLCPKCKHRLWIEDEVVM